MPKDTDDLAREVSQVRARREDEFERSCLNCTAFKYVAGAIPHAAYGECRASVPRPGGTKFASVQAYDWCRDGFAEFEIPSAPAPSVKL